MSLKSYLDVTGATQVYESVLTPSKFGIHNHTTRPISNCHYEEAVSSRLERNSSDRNNIDNYFKQAMQEIPPTYGESNLSHRRVTFQVDPPSGTKSNRLRSKRSVGRYSWREMRTNFRHNSEYLRRLMKF